MKVFWDTNLFIYLWERGPHTESTRRLAAWLDAAGHEVVTSSLTLGEILVQPFRLGNAARVRAYEEAFSQIEVVAFTPAVAREFARLRAERPGLRPPDAIQIASALHVTADALITNDERMQRACAGEPLRILLLPQWEHLRG